MQTVEPAESFAVSRVARAPELSADGPAGVFAAIFESARLSNQQRAEVLGQRSREVGAALSRGEQQAKSASEKSRRADLERTSREKQTPAEASRADQLRSEAQKAEERAKPADHADSAERERAAGRRQDAGGEAHSPNGGHADAEDPQTQQGAGEPAGQTTTSSQDAEGPATNMGSSPAGSAQPVQQAGPGPSAPSDAGASANQSVFAGNLWSIAGLSSLQPGAALVPTPAVPIGQQPQQSEGNPADLSQQDAAQAGAGKGETAGVRPNAPSMDFQNLLNAAGRPEGASAPVRSEVGLSGAGKSDGVKGYNLSESQSITELAQLVRSSIGGRSSSMVLRLDPPELGQLRIDVRMHDQLLNLRVEAQTAAGRDAIEGRLAELKDALEQHGIQLNQVDIELRAPVRPTDQPYDPGAQQHATPQWDGSAAGGQGGHTEGGAQGYSPGPAEDMNEAMSVLGASAQDGMYGRAGSPAETGLDLVI